ncbi:MAG: hypothetical protein ABI324_19325 [Ktedonobacteraceae bacterium]
MTTDENLFPDSIGKKLPPSLVKALDDPFEYALGLRDGRVIRFCEARLIQGGKWVQRIGSGGVAHSGGERGSIEMSGVEYGFPRGREVRLRDIMWVADAPGGS